MSNYCVANKLTLSVFFSILFLVGCNSSPLLNATPTLSELPIQEIESTVEQPDTPQTEATPSVTVTPTLIPTTQISVATATATPPLPTPTATPEVAAHEPLNLGNNPELFLDIAENAAETGTVVEFVGPVTGRTIKYIVYNPQNKPDWANMEARVAAFQNRLNLPFNPNTHGDATYAEVIDTYYDLVLKQADPDGNGNADAVLIRTGNGSNGTASRYSEMHTSLSDINTINIVLGDGNNSESGADGADFKGTGHRIPLPSDIPTMKIATYYQGGQMFFAFLPESTEQGSRSLESATFPNEIDVPYTGDRGFYIMFPVWSMGMFGGTDKDLVAQFRTIPENVNNGYFYLTGTNLGYEENPEKLNNRAINLGNMFGFPLVSVTSN